MTPPHTPKPSTGELHHVALAVHDLKQAVTFYQQVLDLVPLPAPPEAITGGIAWFDLGGGQLHLIEVPHVHPPPRAHLAISVADSDAWRTYLQAKGVDIVEPTIHLYAAKRFFIQDPTGNLIELIQWLEQLQETIPIAKPDKVV